MQFKNAIACIFICIFQTYKFKIYKNMLHALISCLIQRCVCLMHDETALQFPNWVILVNLLSWLHVLEKVFFSSKINSCIQKTNWLVPFILHYFVNSKFLCLLCCKYIFRCTLSMTLICQNVLPSYLIYRK